MVKPYGELERYPLPIITLHRAVKSFGAAENIPKQYTCAVHIYFGSMEINSILEM